MPGTKKVFTLDESELAVRMIEAALKCKRPAGVTAEEAIDALDPEDQARWVRSARAALEYMQERFAAAQPVQ